jgi:hypothetical protein
VNKTLPSSTSPSSESDSPKTEFITGTRVCDMDHIALGTEALLFELQ